MGVGSTDDQIDMGGSGTCEIESLVLDLESFDVSNIVENTLTHKLTDNFGNGV